MIWALRKQDVTVRHLSIDEGQNLFKTSQDRIINSVIGCWKGVHQVAAKLEHLVLSRTNDR